MKRRFTSENQEEATLEMIRYRVYKKRRFYMHLLIYTIGMVMYMAKTYFGAPFNFWPVDHINSFFMWVWSFIIITQGLKLFLRERVFGIDWEQRKIQEFINRDKQNKWE